MSIADKLKKARQLFVEMPEDDQVMAKPAEVPAPTAPEDDIDRRLAQMNETLKQQTNPAPDAAPPVLPASPPTQSAPPAVRTINDLLRESAGPNLEDIQATVSGNDTPPLLPDGTVNFSAIYQKANLPSAPFTAEQMLNMLASLPESLPLDIKRQTVQVTIGAIGQSIGATPETIVADASRKLAALAGYAESVAKQAAEFAAAGEFEIAALLAQADEKRAAIQAAKEQQANVQSRCDAEADRLDDVLEFFSLDIGASKYAPASPASPAP